MASFTRAQFSAELQRVEPLDVGGGGAAAIAGSPVQLAIGVRGRRRRAPEDGEGPAELVLSRLK